MVSTTSLAGLVGLALLSVASGENITSDSYFYGQSPAVYPSPEANGTGDWAVAYAKAKAFVANLTDEEKVNLTAGVTSDTGCSGTIPAISRLGFPGLCVSDASNGLRGTDYVNGYASGIHVGASWNKDLARQRAYHMGSEFRQKGVNLLLGPVVGPLGRVALGGRNWEGVSTDPYLSGILVSETVQGIQSAGVGASTKHFIGYEQETNRNPEDNEQGEEVASISSNIDDQTIHELYLWPFQDAVKAGTASVMCSYNRVNNSYACQNSKTLNGLLKDELGFQGYVISDWDGQHGGIASANAGLDMAMPDSDFWGKNLTTAIANGSMNASRLDDMATRIMTSWYLVGQDSAFAPPGIGMAEDYNTPHQRVIGYSPSSKDTLIQGAIEGHVLVKNTNNALPLKNPRLVSVFGYDAKGPDTMELVTLTLYATTPAIQANNTLWVGGGSGTNSPAYVDAPIAALQRQAYEDGTSLLWNFVDENPVVDSTSDACLVFINAYASEGADRPALRDDFSDNLVNNVAANCSNTIVAIHNAGIRLVDAWVENENVTGVIFAHLPGQDTGKAIVDLLYGRANPSGKLPYTVAKNESDYGALLSPDVPEGDYWLYPQSNFSEGVYIDYRAFDKNDITPRYEFGYGLSYTTFNYTDLSIGSLSVNYTEYPPAAEILPGGNPHLWDVVATVSATIENTGSVDGDEIAQLYLGIPGGPVRQLRGFEKVHIVAGEKAYVSFPLTRRDVSTWDVTAQEWKWPQGTFNVYVGRSSRDLDLTGTFDV